MKNFILTLLTTLLLAQIVSSEYIETEVTFDFRGALPPQHGACNTGERTPDVPFGGPPLNVKYGALLEQTRLPVISKVLCDAYRAAVNELNELSQTFNTRVNFSLEVENTQLQPGYAGQKVAQLASRGTNIVLGPITTEELLTVALSGTAAGVPVITSTASASGYVLGGGNFRMISSDHDQANDIAHYLVKVRNIDHAVIAYRGDVNFYNKVQRAFGNLGGNATYFVHYFPLSYNATFVVEQIEKLSQLHQLENRISVGRFAVILLAEEEWQDIVAEVRSPFLLRQFWIGSAGVARTREPTNPQALEFLSLTTLYASNYYIPEGPLKDKVTDRLRPFGYHLPNPVAFLAYDSVILSGLTAMFTRNTSLTSVNPFSTALINQANILVGSSGRLQFSLVNNRNYQPYAIEMFDPVTYQWKLVTVFEPSSLTFGPPY